VTTPAVLTVHSRLLHRNWRQAPTAGFRCRFRIAPGHYLYRDRLLLTDAAGVPLQAQLPPGDVYDDPEFGRVAVLRGDQDIHLPVPARPGATIGLRYQGCAQGRLCYAPVSVQLQLPE